MDDPPRRICSCCNVNKLLTAEHFKQKKDKTFGKTCFVCSRWLAKEYANKKVSKENLSPAAASNQSSQDIEAKDDSEFRHLPEVKLQDFLRVLATSQNVLSVTACVDITEIKETGRECADLIAKNIWEQMNFRFVYHSKYDHRRSDSIRFMYHCAQISTRQHKPKKAKHEGVKHRDKDAMESFACKGWLHITLSESSDIAFVKIRHDDDHVPYWCIDVPEDIQQYVRDNPDLTMPRLWTEVLKTYGPVPSFSRTSIYRLWAAENSKKWKCDDDEVKSAHILLEEARKLKNLPAKKLYSVEPINLPADDSDGFTAIAFALPESIRKWGGQIRELALDSAWNTNHLSFEVYALLGKVYGSGLPLGYLLIQSNQGVAGGKEQYLRHVLCHFNKTWNIQALVTLMDKDWSEINAFLREAIKRRLSILRRQPAPYKSTEASSEFHFIDPAFVPVAQQTKSQGVCTITYIL
ncbi:hypothetical protein C8J56DRAFT_794595 [Mycena floridula]|nr:hypothetical protein C8J56DRAFT_794595 [Mycena floridula]